MKACNTGAFRSGIVFCKNPRKKMKKGIDKRGDICYSNQAVRERSSLKRRREKSFEKAENKA